MTQPLLEVQDLHTVFSTKEGWVKAVDGVSFELHPGETLGIVGESGCGKSVTALSIMRLQRPGLIKSGRVMFKGEDLTKATEAEMREVRGREIAMIFQDPMTSLNPVFRTGWQVAEPLRLHHGWNAKKSLTSAINMLGKVGIPSAVDRAEDYPHQFSGGMRQRVMIAMGLTTTPEVLIADEPTTALDVTIQAQILDLLRHVNQEFGTATILITHNLGVVAGMCKRIIVMYAGRIVEAGPTTDVFAHPKHPYTWALLRSIPRLDAERHEPLKPIDGLPPNLVDLPSGCAFHPRCAFKIEKCSRDVPALQRVGDTQLSACWVTQAGTELKGA
ncbi:MAG: ABC transporter ATP-binding protein [Chloroflexi bacterium]|nr:MAG: ABC transporter ATP-binding protein [Chloroflexota bacterium]TME03278.1 MAG: ABC transporter ATP-binding protein [Chloroflexota bacterium]TME42817.1 MAG: ABC transporter ATP-binding protein [Chloroflexota bacterium]TME53307.1 MAG: ABC transporter ATP-binding protein [Chloroflexota bacterium]